MTRCYPGCRRDVRVKVAHDNFADLMQEMAEMRAAAGLENRASYWITDTNTQNTRIPDGCRSQSPLLVPERQRNSQRPWILPGTVARLAVESRPVMDRI